MEADGDRSKHSLTRVLFEEESHQREKRVYGGFIEGIHRFDHFLFDIPREMVLGLPPELRLFLEIAWETFEDAGYSRIALQELQTRYQKGVGVLSALCIISILGLFLPWEKPFCVLIRPIGRFQTEPPIFLISAGRVWRSIPPARVF